MRYETTLYGFDEWGERYVTTGTSTFTLTKRASTLAMRLVRRSRKMRWARDFPNTALAEEARLRIHQAFLDAGYTMLDGEDIKLPPIDPQKAWKDACIGAQGDDARLVYADILTQRGDARGELIVAQARTEGELVDEAAVAIAERLLRQERATFLGPLAARAARGHVHWRRGFVDAVFLARDRDDPDLEGLLVASLTHASGELLRDLTLYIDSRPPDFPRRDRRVIESVAMLTALAPPALETLTLATETSSGAATHLGDLTPLFASIPRLTHFKADGTSFSFSKPLVAPELATMTLSGMMEDATLEALSMSTFPRLDHLAVTTPTRVPAPIASALRTAFGSRLALTT